MPGSGIAHVPHRVFMDIRRSGRLKKGFDTTRFHTEKVINGKLKLKSSCRFTGTFRTSLGATVVEGALNKDRTVMTGIVSSTPDFGWGQFTGVKK